MNTYKIVVHDNSYLSYLVEANSAEEAQTYVENGDLDPSASHIADWDIISITPYVEPEA